MREAPGKGGAPSVLIDGLTPTWLTINHRVVDYQPDVGPQGGEPAPGGISATWRRSSPPGTMPM